MKKQLFITLLSCSILFAFGQPSPQAVKYADLVAEKGLRDKLSIIASDALEGRMTGTRGQKMAAAFIAHHFREIGLKGPVNGSYEQTVPLTKISPGENLLSAGTESFGNFSDYFYVGFEDTDGLDSAPAVFAGNGTAEEISTLTLTNKAAVVVLKEAGMAGIGATLEIAERLRAKGALTVLFTSAATDQEFGQMAAMIRNWMGNGMLTLDGQSGFDVKAFFIRKQVAEKIFSTTYAKLEESTAKKNLKKVKEARISWKNSFAKESLSSENVLGYLEGTDKKDELVIVTAHFDHVGANGAGEDKIFNGADDDGSGTVSVMQIAEAFAKAAKEGNRPRRSMLFMTVTGEEEGLFGSSWYVSNPVFPLSNTVVDLNIDMIGRRDPGHAQNRNYVYVIGSDKLSTELHSLHEQLNKATLGMDLDYTYNDQNHPERLYYRSDHWNFAKNKVPIIFYFDGIHEDYHKVSDEVSKIDFDILERRARLVFHTAWEIANREGRIMPDADKR
ncbi:MAG: M28 family peptidase [Bacteroidota bacterium]